MCWKDTDVSEAGSTSETSENFYQTTRCNIPEDRHLHTLRCENLKSHQDPLTFLHRLRSVTTIMRTILLVMLAQCMHDIVYFFMLARGIENAEVQRTHTETLCILLTIHLQMFLTMVRSILWIELTSIGGPIGPPIEASSIDQTQQIRFTR
jgi:hypothetical protein